MNTSPQESFPRSTSEFTEKLDAIVRQTEELERLTNVGASELEGDPLEHVAAMQEAMNALQDEMAGIKDLQNDNNMFGALASLHSRKVHAGIELCVQWAQNRIDALLIAIRDAKNSSVSIGEEDEMRQWWHTPRGTDNAVNARVDEAERAYEQAAITVQALNAEDNARLMPAIAEMKSRLLSIAPCASSDADAITEHALVRQNP